LDRTHCTSTPISIPRQNYLYDDCLVGAYTQIITIQPDYQVVIIIIILILFILFSLVHWGAIITFILFIIGSFYIHCSSPSQEDVSFWWPQRPGLSGKLELVPRTLCVGRILPSITHSLCGTTTTTAPNQQALDGIHGARLVLLCLEGATWVVVITATTAKSTTTTSTISPTKSINTTTR